MKLFLDDVRIPADSSWNLVKTAEDAMTALVHENVTFASLDHDLADGHYPWNAGYPYPENAIIVETTKEKTGYDVVCFMEEHDIWPVDGVRVHSQNPVGVERMVKVIEKHYGRNFQTRAINYGAQ